MKGFPKTVSIPTLPLFIEGNRRVSENRQRVHSLSVEREPIRDRLPGSIPRRGDGEGEQRRSWNTILRLKLKLGNQKASALCGWNLKFKI